MKIITLPAAEKLKLLQEHSSGSHWTKLSDKKWCLHCGKEFSGESTRVWQDIHRKLWLSCGTPDCDGSPIDWSDYPWWDEKHSLTKAYKKIDFTNDPAKN